MSDLLIATNKWLECCHAIKTCKKLIEHYPNDLSLQVILQEREKREPKLKAEKDILKWVQIRENLEETYQDCGSG